MRYEEDNINLIMEIDKLEMLQESNDVIALREQLQQIGEKIRLEANNQ